MLFCSYRNTKKKTMNKWNLSDIEKDTYTEFKVVDKNCTSTREEVLHSSECSIQSQQVWRMLIWTVNR